jgi:hypothetical protein
MTTNRKRAHVNGQSPVSETSERLDRIAEAAYYSAERRGFAPGHEVEDWLEAEKKIDGEGAELVLPAPAPININVREEIRGRDRPSPLDAGLPDEPDERVERRRTRRAA